MFPKMALHSKLVIPILSLLVLLRLSLSQEESYPPLTLTVFNNCPFTVCPGIQPNSGHAVLLNGGFCLNTLTHLSFPAPNRHWSGRIWARTGCSHSSGRFTCATGDCGGRLECSGAGGAPPSTLVQLSLHHGEGAHHDLSSYGVSLVDGFNVPMTVTPHEGQGRCPVVGCKENILATCPDVLQVRAPHAGGGTVVGCKSGCAAFGTDELCCRNMYNSPRTCRASKFSEFFKSKCPDTFTYAHDSPSLTHECSSPKELKVIFCH